jgi:predicted TIM-barrel fold metal-dependent hydrolase
MPVVAWKTYCHIGGPGWYLDDRDPAAPQVGRAFIENVRRLGPKIIAVHKGFAGTARDGGHRYASPVDIGPVAKDNPDITFVVYHSGFDVGNPPERAYREEDDWGVNRLITSCRKAGIGPGGNVVAELGSTWRTIMANPTAAAHLLGKLLVAFGPDNIAWGTDSIWYGSPQDQIQAFRAFEISEELQGRFGYPALTKEVKAKILGLNSIRLYGVKPLPAAARIPRDQLEQARIAVPVADRTLGPVTPRQVEVVARAELADVTGPA